MVHSPIGHYRCSAVGSREEEAYVEDGAIASFVPRSSYESNGYKPPFESLPTQEEYETAQRAGSERANRT